ncbi:MAG: ABC transporter substrate-binding protein [Vulcanibacillus sp.]
MKKTALSAIAALLIFIILSGCSNEKKEDITIMLDWTPNTNHTGLYVAIKNGYYDDQGLKVTIIQATGGNTAQIVASGKAEFGISYQEEVTYARTNQIPIVSIATIIQHNTSGFASPKDKEITNPKDFEGKTYGGWGSPIESAVIKSIMEKNGGDISKVEFVNSGAADFFTATTQDIDFEWIYYGWTGIEAELRNYPINYIELAKLDSQLDFYTPVIITSESYIKENTDTIKKFMEATTQGYEFAIQNPEEAARILTESVSGINKELVLESQIWLSQKYQEDSKQWGIQESHIWENYAKWMYDQKLITKLFSVDEAFTNDFLPER